MLPLLLLLAGEPPTVHATLRVGAKSVETRVQAEDLAGPGWKRWRYRLGVEAEPLLAPLLDRRTTGRVCEGVTWREAPGSWRLELRPAGKPAGEKRCETLAWTVLRVEGRLELLVEELAP